MAFIELKNINKGYENKIILNNFNLEINKNEFISIMGESGAGKTTLLNILGGIDTDYNGDVVIDGLKNPWKSKKDGLLLLREGIGYLFQNYALIDNKSIDKNLDIALSYVKKSKEEKKELKLNALKNVGIDIPINTPIYKLSGGEQQRIAIARLFLKPSKIILADEPTGALDEKNKNSILKLLKSLNDLGKTVIIVTHDLKVGEASDRIVNIL